MLVKCNDPFDAILVIAVGCVDNGAGIDRHGTNQCRHITSFAYTMINIEIFLAIGIF